MSRARRRLSGLTARTVVITSLVALMAFCILLLIGQAFGRLHDQVERLTRSDLERLMSSVRLAQQTESLVSLGLILVQSENHGDRRAALVELTDRFRWIGKLTEPLLSGSTDAEFVAKVRGAGRQLEDNVAELDRLLRRRIDGAADAADLAAIRQRSLENREIAGTLSVLMGYDAASVRSELSAQGRRLQEDAALQRRNLAVFAALLLAAVILSGLYFEVHVVRRIQRMRQALSRGDVDPQDLRVVGRDEIVELAETMRGYVERIQAQEARMQKAHEELAFLAEHDPLTGLANRRHFAAAAQRLLARGAQPLCLAIVDVDHFKRVNDTHGHEVGDRALVHVAAHASSGLRADDILARFGGEEFVALLPVRTLDDAQRVCDALRARIEGAPMMLGAGRPLSLTVSIGLTVIPVPRGDALDDPEQLEQLIQQAMRRADASLYAAKADGRNLVRLATAES
ncbi:GGDEF domain-containing protein [Quisquiliibacterium transsilvanicum]|jgi:diguanylate cyclase (GGDEF)-like protein|uniref:diguanylate cyclase n=1 Tax=Quisquiliibacterium transsilvanicum TaxID=1549638 RepID=A0A7W8HEW0_9BURK|nr:GGDEF domain-containing protein [Quisquiliibacterium transsilvanicum]MBB5270618.1 diguanylate cyclase (GGDEF)-like protein [Quisquiliibacterium transsilvanicum]